jgi:hypothetical protein
MIRALLAAVAIVVAPALAHAQGGLGRARADESLDVGSVAVKVVLGSMSRPATSLPVSLVDDASGKERVVRTDANGVALFRGLAVGSRHSAYSKIDEKELASEPMDVPSSGGVRVILSPAPIQDGPSAEAPVASPHGGGGPMAGGMPDPRQMSGIARPESGDAAGTLTVRALQGKFRTDPIAGRVADFPEGATIHLVGYHQGGKISVDSRPLDKEGRVSFDKLATDNSTSYYALATFARKDKVDRLQSSSLEMPPQVGLRVMLAGLAVDSTEAGVDDLPIFRQRPGVKLPGPGEVIVELAGRPQRIAEVELLNAGTGAVVGKAKVTPGAAITSVRGEAGPPAADTALRDQLVQVEVFGPGGTPVPNAEIAILAPGGEVLAKASTGADGRANLEGPAAGQAATAVATVHGHPIQSASFEVPARGGMRVRFAASWQSGAESLTARFTGVAGEPGAVYVARTSEGGQVYLSPPFQMVPDRGAVVGILIYPKILVAFQGGAELDDERMWFSLKFSIANPSLTPLDTGEEGLLLPLPPGFIGASVADEMATRVKVDPDHGFIWRGPFPPGQRDFMSSFALPVEDGVVTLAMPLPYGLWQSHLVFEDFPGMELEVPPNAQREVRETPDGRRFILLSGINIREGQSLQLRIRGLPQAPGWKRWVRVLSGLAVLALLAWGFVSLILARRREDEETAEDRRERLLAKVVALDEKWAKNAISAREHTSQREALIAELEEVYRELNEDRGAG